MFPLIVVDRVCRLVGQMFDRIRWLVKVFYPPFFFLFYFSPSLSLSLTLSKKQALRRRERYLILSQVGIAVVLLSWKRGGKIEKIWPPLFPSWPCLLTLASGGERERRFLEKCFHSFIHSLTSWTSGKNQKLPVVAEDLAIRSCPDPKMSNQREMFEQWTIWRERDQDYIYIYIFYCLFSHGRLTGYFIS